jgi:hypothetical protein
MRGEPAALTLGNDQGSLAAVRPDYRNDSGAGVSTEGSSDLLVANLRSRSSDPAKAFGFPRPAGLDRRDRLVAEGVARGAATRSPKSPTTSPLKVALQADGRFPSGKTSSSKDPPVNTFASSLTITRNSMSVRSVFIRFTSAQVTTTLVSSPGVWCSKAK